MNTSVVIGTNIEKVTETTLQSPPTIEKHIVELHHFDPRPGGTKKGQTKNYHLISQVNDAVKAIERSWWW